MHWSCCMESFTKPFVMCISGCGELWPHLEPSVEPWAASYWWPCADHARRPGHWSVASLHHLPLHQGPHGKQGKPSTWGTRRDWTSCTVMAVFKTQACSSIAWNFIGELKKIVWSKNTIYWICWIGAKWRDGVWILLSTRNFFKLLRQIPSASTNLRWVECRDHFVYVPNQWEMTLQCNIISYWLGALTEWSLEWCLQEHGTFTSSYLCDASLTCVILVMTL